MRNGLWSLISCLVSIALILCCALSYAESEKPTLAKVERLFLREHYDRVIQEADKLIDSRAHRLDEIYYLKALSQLKLKKFGDARDSFSAVVSKFQKSRRMVDSYIGIGDSYFLEGDIKLAINAYQDVLVKYPDDKNISIVYYKMGNCYKEIGSNDKAEEYLNKAKSLSPLSFEAKMTLDSGIRKVPRTEVNEYFSVQIGSFKNRRNAENLTSKLAKNGYESFMELPVGSGDKLYRVKVGRLKSAQEAEILESRLRNLGYQTKICVKDAYE